MVQAPIVWGTILATAISGCSLFLSLDGAAGGEGEPSIVDVDAADAAGAVEEAQEASADAGIDGPMAPPGCPQEVLDPDLVAWYPLDEGSGNTIKDCSGRDHGGLITGAPVGGSWVPGRRGMALRFDKGGGCVDLSIAPHFRLSSAEFTLSVWAQYGPEADTGYLVGKTTNISSRGWRLATSKQNAHFQVVEPADGGVALRYVEEKNVPAVTWIHLVAVYVPNERVDLWVDGTLKQSTPLSGALIEDEKASLRFGCRSSGGYNYAGLLDDVRLYKRALTSTEIQALAK